MTQNIKNQHRADELLAAALLGDLRQPVNDNLLVRAEVPHSEQRWQTASIPGLQVRILEYRSVPRTRLTALLRVDPAVESATIPAVGVELLVQHGLVADDETEYLHPFYLRNPADRAGAHAQLTLHCGSGSRACGTADLEFYLAIGQLENTDMQRRCINLADSNLWLPGPVEHTQVLPLHMHNGSNAMLVRWLKATTFRPRLDPLGEEVLVINGKLHDALGSYTSGSWIRNPVAAWQAWSGEAGTTVYYKNGHFGDL